MPTTNDPPSGAPEPADSHPSQSPPATPAPPHRIKAHILLAEDNEANMTTLTDFLGAKGYRVSVARDGIEAVSKTRSQAPDLILMDIQMPKMSGLEAIERIQADATTSNIPTIALTALAMPGDRERCLEAGACDYLSKPVRLKTLSELIAKTLEVQDREVKVPA